MNLALRSRGHRRNGNEHVYDRIYSPTLGTSLWETAPMAAALLDPTSFYLFRDDFDRISNAATTGYWVLTTDTGGSVALQDAAGGTIKITCDGDDNDESYLASIKQNFLFAASKPLWFEARVKCAEIGALNANLLVGLSDGSGGADSLLDTAAGPAASYDGAGFFKVGAGTVWQFESSNAGTQVTTASAGAFTDDTWTRLGFIFDPANGTTGSIVPYFNGVEGTAQAITLAGLEEMAIVLGVKGHTAASDNEEVLQVDWVQVLAVR